MSWRRHALSLVALALLRGIEAACIDDTVCAKAAASSVPEIAAYAAFITSCPQLNGVAQSNGYPLWCSDASFAPVASCCLVTCPNRCCGGSLCTSAPTAAPTLPTSAPTIAPTVAGATPAPTVAPSAPTSTPTSAPTDAPFPRTDSFCARKVGSAGIGQCSGELHYFEQITRYHGAWNPCVTSSNAPWEAGPCKGVAAMEPFKDVCSGQSGLNLMCRPFEDPVPFSTRAECSKFYTDPSTHSDFFIFTHPQAHPWSPPPFQPNISFIEKCHINNPLTDFTRCELDPFCGISDALGVSGPNSILLADVDGDLDFDVFVTTGGGRLLYWENTGSRSVPQFTPRAGAAHPLGGDDALSKSLWEANKATGVDDYLLSTRVTLFDADEDGVDDMVIGGRFGLLRFAKGNGDGTFATPPACNSTSIADRLAETGCPPLLARVSHYAHSDAVELCNMAPLFTDVDGDGQLDLVLFATPLEEGSTMLVPGCNQLTGASTMSTFGSNTNVGRIEVLLRRGDRFENISISASPFKDVQVGLYQTATIGDVDGDGRDEMLATRTSIDRSSLTWYSKAPRGPHEYGGFGYSWEPNWPSTGIENKMFMNVPFKNNHFASIAQIADLDNDGLVDIITMNMIYDLSQRSGIYAASRMEYYHHAVEPNAPACATELNEIQVAGVRLSPQCGDVFTNSTLHRFPATCVVDTCTCAAGWEGTWDLAAADLGCVECSPGRYSAVPGMPCAECLPGRFWIGATADAPGSCSGSCAKGTFSNRSGLSSSEGCTNCAQGRYSETPGAAVCAGKCDIGRYGTSDGAEGESVCAECSSGRVAITGQSECSLCGEGSAPDPNKVSCETCPVGAYLAGEAGCVQCPVRVKRCGGAVLELEEGVWYPPHITTLTSKTPTYNCFNDESCIRSNLNHSTRVKCNTARGYHGPLCGACDRDNEYGQGSFTRSGRGCLECWAAWQSWWVVATGVVGLIVLIGYFVVHHDFGRIAGDFTATVQKIAISHLQMLGMLGIFKARGTTVFNDVMSRPAEVIGGSFTSILPIKCALNSQIYGPFIVNMSLPVALLLVAALCLIPKTIAEKQIRKQRADKELPVFKGRWNLPRWIARCKLLRIPMTDADVLEYRDRFLPSQRFAGVTVFMLFTLYPTLVRSLASVYNCTAPVEDVVYLVADLTVKCYEGMHVAFLTVASVFVVVYAVGIPAAVGLSVTLHFPIKIENRQVKCHCTWRQRSEYSSTAMRSRFAFLFNGYHTNRSRFVVAWEALVMLRKLAVTIVGSAIEDPYLQILAALLILVVSCVATSYVQPYEREWLNLLDVLGLFALIATQIFSIVYFYTASSAASATFTAEQRHSIEIATTALLFTVNVLVLLIFGVAFGSELIGAREYVLTRRRSVLKLASRRETRAALVRNTPKVSEMWCHPSGVAVAEAPTPQEVEIETVSTDIVWIWAAASDDEMELAFSTEMPELMILIKGADLLPAGASYRWMNRTSKRLSQKEVKPRDVGGWTCGSTEGDAIESNIVENGGVELQFVVKRPVLLKKFEVARLTDDKVTMEDKLTTAEAEILKLKLRSVHDRNVKQQLQEDIAKLEIELSTCKSSITQNDECWYYSYDDDAASESHGPETLKQLKIWRDEGHFDNTLRVWRGDDDVAVESRVVLLEVLHNEGLDNDAWWFPDGDDSSVQHGPFPLAQFKTWCDEGHFSANVVISNGKEGELIMIANAIAAMGAKKQTHDAGDAMVAAQDEVSVESGALGNTWRRKGGVRAESRC